MSLMDSISDALVAIKNAENATMKECLVRPASKLLGEILKVMQSRHYVDAYEFIDDGREGLFKITLTGKINECRAIKPRYAVKKDGYEKYEKRFLPSKDVGILVVSTSKGVVSHIDAKAMKTGGRLLAYVY